MNREYKKELESLTFSEEAKKRIAANLADSQTANAPKKGGFQVMRFAAASAAVVALTAVLGGFAYASGALVSVGNALDDLFAGAPAQTEVVDKIGKPIGASAESNGIVISADAIIGDRSNYAIVYSISKNDGTAFEGLDELKAKMAGMPDVASGLLPLSFEEGTAIDIDGVNGGGGGSYFYDSDPDDNAIQYVTKMSVDTSDGGGIIGKTARVNLKNIILYDPETMEPSTWAEGTWNLKFEIAYEDTSIDMPAGFEADCNGLDATVSEITISPIAITVSYTVEGTMDWEDQESGKTSDHNAAEQDRFMNLPVIITMADGSVIDATESGASLNEHDGMSDLRKSRIFDEFINLDEIKSMTIGGTKVTMPQ